MMQLVVNYPSPPPLGLCQASVEAGYYVELRPEGAFSNDPSGALAFANTYNPLPVWQKQQMQAVAEQYATIIAAGYTYSNVLVAIDDVSQQKITAMAAIASNTLAGLITTAWPTTFAWAPMGFGASLSLPTPQNMIAFGAAIGHYVSNVILYAESLTQQIASAPSVAAVQAINITAGWPIN